MLAVRNGKFMNTVLVLWVAVWVCFGILITVCDVESKNKTVACNRFVNKTVATKECQSGKEMLP